MLKNDGDGDEVDSDIKLIGTRILSRRESKKDERKEMDDHFEGIDLNQSNQLINKFYYLTQNVT